MIAACELAAWYPWRVSNKADPDGCALADRHYSRRKVGAPQFMPPGETIVLVANGALFGWWRPHPASELRSMNGLDGWTCSIFRNESHILSSYLILAAEMALFVLAKSCGPDGMLSYVFDKKIRSVNPGCCFKKAGWHRAGKRTCCHGMKSRSADNRKTLLHKPFEMAGRKEGA